MVRFWLYVLARTRPHSGVPLSATSGGRSVMSICPNVGDVGLDHLIKVMFDMCFLFEVVLSFCT